MVSRKIIMGLGVTSVVLFCATGYTRNEVEKYFSEQEYYKKAIEVLMKHQPSMDILGHPVKYSRIRLSDVNNKMNTVKASIVIPVSGETSSGKLFVDASRDSPEKVWAIDEIKLFVDGHPNKYLSVCKLESCNKE